ncbi:MAG: flippase-like domain-containing protein [bacterium]|nr:flippase-like domain-containing protein [bacterium]
MLTAKLKHIFVRLEVQILAAFLFGLIFFTFLSFWGNYQHVFQNISRFPIKLALLALSATFLNYLLRFFRFHYLLKQTHLNLKLRHAVATFFSGLAASVTPAKSGELTKAYFIKKLSLTKTTFSTAAPIVIFERLSDALGTLVLMSWGLWYYPQARFLIFFVVIAVTFFLFLITHQAAFDRIYFILKKFAFLDSMTNHMHNFHVSLKNLLTPRNLIFSSFLALIAWSFEVVTFALVFYGLTQHINFHIIAILAFIFTFTSILGFLTMIPGGLGVTEGSKLGLLTLFFALDKSLAVSIVILVRIFTLWFGVSLGVIALFYLTSLLAKNAYTNT